MEGWDVDIYWVEKCVKYEQGSTSFWVVCLGKVWGGINEDAPIRPQGGPENKKPAGTGRACCFVDNSSPVTGAYK